MPKRGTLQEIARKAKVSPATVSRVINRSSPVSPEAAARVRAAAEKLGLELRRTQKSRVIAFVLANRSLLHPFHSQVLISAHAYCAAQEYSTVFFSLDYPENVHWKKLHLPRILERRDSADGFILAGVNHQNLLDLLASRNAPFAVFGDTVQGDWNAGQCDAVWIEDIHGAYEMTRRLLALGHRKIWYVANSRLTWFARRRQGYIRAMQEAGLEPLYGDLDSDQEREVGFLAVRRILSKGERPDAIFAGSDATGHGVYDALREAGIGIPADISVAAFNDTPEATLLHPPLTSVRVFPEQVGRSLAQMVIARIENPALPPQEYTIATQVIRRESCQPRAFVAVPAQPTDPPGMAAVPGSLR
jgi:DNA-binding LacI/PurR family transcriptional regulator